jgi:hypothetical protein
MRRFADIKADTSLGRGRDRFRSATYHLRRACDATAPKGRGTARLLGVQAAGCPASPSSSETRCLSASRLLIVVIDPMCKRSSTDTNCVSPIDSARECALPKLTFQVIRRTIATLAQKKGTIKDVQGVMRHSRTATTTNVYMQEIPASVQSTINSINSELRKSDVPNRKKLKEPAPAGAVVSSRRKASARVTQNDTKSWKREGVLRFRHMLDFEGVVWWT